MPFKYYRKESKKEWGSIIDGDISFDQIKLGAILRIADATEVMARQFNDLINENKRIKESLEYKENLIVTLRRSNASLRGHIRRIKNS